MNMLQAQVKSYLEYCRYQKRLDEKTLKAYRIDLEQFQAGANVSDISQITPAILESFIAGLHQKYKPKTVKRKIASLKAIFRYFEYRDLIGQSPFHKVQVKFREPVILPKAIPLHTVEHFLGTIYKQRKCAKTDYQKKGALRDIAVIELLFATGMRISELCSLKIDDVNLEDKTILIYGKGAKERRIQLGNDDVTGILEEYRGDYFSRMINKYTAIAGIGLHITPHMFRHTFATSLLEADVDIRYIQKMLGHSSINITEIYTHVTMEKQRDILATKHPRKDFSL